MERVTISSTVDASFMVYGGEGPESSSVGSIKAGSGVGIAHCGQEHMSGAYIMMI